MLKYQSILLPLDFSAAGQPALEAGAHLAQTYDSRLHLFHAVDVLPEHLLTWQFLLEANQERLQEFADTLSDRDLDVHVLPVLGGSPVETILTQAENLDVDVMVLGAGHTSGGGGPVGHVAEAILQRSTAPVLAVVPTARAGPWHRLLCAVDHSPASRCALRNAIRLAAEEGAELRVLSVIPEPSGQETGGDDQGWSRARAEHHRHWQQEYEQFVEELDFGDVRWTREIRAGVPHEQIRAAAEEFSADLLVMGSIGRSRLWRALLGSVTRRMLKRLPCSLMTFKTEALESALTAEDRQVLELLVAEGEALMLNHSFHAALIKFHQVLARNPFHRAALQRRAEACDHLGRRDEALRLRRRLDALPPES